MYRRVVTITPSWTSLLYKQSRAASLATPTARVSWQHTCLLPLRQSLSTLSISFPITSSFTSSTSIAAFATRNHERTNHLLDSAHSIPLHPDVEDTTNNRAYALYSYLRLRPRRSIFWGKPNPFPLVKGFLPGAALVFLNQKHHAL